MTKLIDTNLLIYSLIPKAKYHENIAELFKELLEDKNTQIAVAQQNIVEAHKTLSTVYKQNKKASLAKVLDLVNVLNAKIIYPQRSTLSNYSELLLKSKPRFDYFDNYLVATMISNSVKAIYTANEKDFADIKDIRVINPTI